MAHNTSLLNYFFHSVRNYPQHTFVVDTQGMEYTYGEAHQEVLSISQVLRQYGVRPGDRVGFLLPKSCRAVFCLLGILHCRAVYVPLDVSSPASRLVQIIGDCELRLVVVSPYLMEAISRGLCEQRNLKLELVDSTVLEPPDTERGSSPQADVSAIREVQAKSEDAAYILNTSGSTGKPKGVVISHGAATAFVDWAARIVSPGVSDRFSSHAPFHFDLSIFDLFLCMKAGASVYLIDDRLGKSPRHLAEFIHRYAITIWYSTPSVLISLMEFGRLRKDSLISINTLLFAGEVFPLKHLRELQNWCPSARMYNLYGPTETNVCTYYSVPNPLPEGFGTSLPIGVPCEHYRVKVFDSLGNEVEQGSKGELLVSGSGIMKEYFNQEELTAKAFYTDSEGTRWYRTGDLVRWNRQGMLEFFGRLDRMVKRRGYRIELGEIESALTDIDEINLAAVVVVVKDDKSPAIHAFVHPRHERPLSIIHLKKELKERIPLYMFPDAFHFVTTIPMTLTSKIDYQALEAQLNEL